MLLPSSIGVELMPLLFRENLPGIDIVATNYDKTSMAYIQVKTKREESKNWAGWIADWMGTNIAL